MTGPPTPVLSVRDLSVRFPTERGILHAVDGVSFDLHAGGTLAVVGESGSGKTALSRAVMQLSAKDARVTGDVLFEGQDLRGLSAAEERQVWGAQIGMVFQDPSTALNPVMRIGAQITETLRTHLPLNRSEATDRALRLLADVGIPEPRRRLSEYPHQLSGGMRQRVCIALAVACRPRLLLADEPTTALDVTIQRQILDLLGQLQREQSMALVLVTHDLGVVANRAAEVLIMYGGRIVEAGPTGALFNAPRHPYTAALLAAVPRLARPSHLPLATIPGQPADVVDPSPGCRFASRCLFAQPRCRNENPPLLSEGSRRIACFHPVPSPPGTQPAVATSPHAARERSGRNGLPGEPSGHS